MVIRRTGDKLLLSKYVFFFIMLIPAFLTYRADLGALYDGWHMLQLLIALCALMIYVVVYRFDNITVNCVLTYYIIAMISTIHSGYSINTIKWDIAADVGIAVGAYLLIRRNRGMFLNAVSTILFCYLMINTMTNDFISRWNCIWQNWTNCLAFGREKQYTSVDFNRGGVPLSRFNRTIWNNN